MPYTLIDSLVEQQYKPRGLCNIHTRCGLMPHELVDTPQANYKTSLLDFGNCPVKR